ncbi:hypothetical protein [Amycolatopsis sp. WAC 04197]|uniref:hypothetical protein n=1 Tax=Amycolatopsis sp. WAC 04197 TaxID=2203199 RepID=UPI000F7B0310|nr:hypothetical protein [Amycolatopsis sp. WAC 04197]
MSRVSLASTATRMSAPSSRASPVPDLHLAALEHRAAALEGQVAVGRIDWFARALGQNGARAGPTNT